MPPHIENRRARHEYTVLETFEAGIQLVGTEVKSLREGKCQLLDAFVSIDKGQAWLRNARIDEYTPAGKLVRPGA